MHIHKQASIDVRDFGGSDDWKAITNQLLGDDEASIDVHDFGGSDDLKDITSQLLGDDAW